MRAIVLALVLVLVTSSCSPPRALQAVALATTIGGTSLTVTAADRDAPRATVGLTLVTVGTLALLGGLYWQTSREPAPGWTYGEVSATASRAASGASETRCRFGDCAKDGWSTSSPSGSSETRCKFGDCQKYGWTTTSSDGRTLDCTCKFHDCQANGVVCR